MVSQESDLREQSVVENAGCFGIILVTGYWHSIGTKDHDCNESGVIVYANL